MTPSLPLEDLCVRLGEHGADRLLIRYVMRFVEDRLPFAELWSSTHDGPTLLALVAWSGIERDEVRSVLGESIRSVLQFASGESPVDEVLDAVDAITQSSRAKSVVQDVETAESLWEIADQMGVAAGASAAAMLERKIAAYLMACTAAIGATAVASTTQSFAHWVEIGLRAACAASSWLQCRPELGDAKDIRVAHALVAHHTRGPLRRSADVVRSHFERMRVEIALAAAH